LTPDEARIKARALLAAVDKGENPAEDIKARRVAPTVAEACERFMSEHVATRCKSSTPSEYRRSIDLFIAPAIGPLKLADGSFAILTGFSSHTFPCTPPVHFLFCVDKSIPLLRTS
jgi:hypothetical protein